MLRSGLAIVCLLTCTIIPPPTYSQWTLQNAGTAVSLNGVCFVDSLRGWIVGDSGIVLHTTNAGREWTRQNSGTLGSLLAVSFCDSANGWVGGDQGVLLKTTDGGKLWRRVIHDTSFSVRHFKIHCLSAQNTIVLRDSFSEDVYCCTSLWKTTDGGNSWTGITPEQYAYLHDFSFTTPDSGWTGGMGGMPHGTLLSRTTNGGATWETIHFNFPTIGSGINRIHFINAREGWAAAGDTLYQTTDGGNSWNVAGAHHLGSLADLIMFGDVGYAAQWYGKIAKTTDGGANWFKQRARLSGFVFDLDFVNRDIGWAVGYNGLILHTDNGGEGDPPQYVADYPLHIGDRWQYEWEFSTVERSVLSDTLMPNGYRYAITSFGTFERQEGNKVFEYLSSKNSEWLRFDFDGFPGDTLLTTIDGTDTLDLILTWSSNVNAWGVSRPSWSFLRVWRNVFDGFVNETVVDSIGVFSQLTYPVQLWLRGAVIDGRRFGTITGVQDPGAAPEVYSLEQNFPNPFNPSTTFRFALPHRAHVLLNVFDVLGREVACLLKGEMEAGYHDLKWEPFGLASGIYFYRLSVSSPHGSFIQTRSLMILK